MTRALAVTHATVWGWWQWLQRRAWRAWRKLRGRLDPIMLAALGFGLISYLLGVLS